MVGDIGLCVVAPVANDDRPTPFFIIGDDVFPLRTLLMKPFSQRNMEIDECIFNYHCPVHAEFRRMPLASWRTVGDVC